MTTTLSRDARVRRGGRGRGWALLTTLLVLALGASSALVFTDRIELLKLAVILSLWAAVVAAFVSVIYRRQSDVAQARARDMKLVYDLQLDREIAARREYELTVESHLRRELVAELRAESADEIAALRSELVALRHNLEILFDADLEHRPALETDRSTVRAFSDRASDVGEPAGWAAGGPMSPVFAADPAGRTIENPILDVPEVAAPATGHPADEPAHPAPGVRGQHRRSAGGEQPPSEPVRYWQEPAAPPQPEPVEEPPAWPRGPAQPAAAAWQPPPAEPGWHPVGAEGQWLPAGAPGSRWESAGEPAPAPEPRPGRHSGPREPAPAGQPGWQPNPEPAEYQPRHAPRAGYTPPMPTRPEPAARHRSVEEPPVPPVPPEPPAPVEPVEPVEPAGRRSTGQPVADLLARLQVDPASTGRRRRRQD